MFFGELESSLPLLLSEVVVPHTFKDSLPDGNRVGNGLFYPMRYPDMGCGLREPPTLFLLSDEFDVGRVPGLYNGLSTGHRFYRGKTEAFAPRRGDDYISTVVEE